MKSFEYHIYKMMVKIKWLMYQGYRLPFVI